ncbi:MAG: hypothetical protein Q9M92_15580 [Enterobacterales bacterium]|nr:hypothetical protein [Enterobacterales bacterium]
MDTFHYTSQLDNALKLIRALDFNRALPILYQLLNEKPHQHSLIEQIYNIEWGRQSNSGFRKICWHVFSIKSMSSELTPIVIQAVSDYKTMIDPQFKLNGFNRQQIFNLLFHLSHQRGHRDSDRLYEEVKTRFADDLLTPRVMYNFCEGLIKDKRIIRAREELKYLLLYYAENEVRAPAEHLLKAIL